MSTNKSTSFRPYLDVIFQNRCGHMTDYFYLQKYATDEVSLSTKAYFVLSSNVSTFLDEPDTVIW